MPKPIPDLHPNWKVMRRLADTVLETVDATVDAIMDEPTAFQLDTNVDDEDLRDDVQEQVLNLLIYMLLPSDSTLVDVNDDPIVLT